MTWKSLRGGPGGYASTPILSRTRVTIATTPAIDPAATKRDALINALYLELVRERDEAALAGVGAAPTARGDLWRTWERYARWHLDHRDAANFILQCEASGILSEETRARQQETEAARLPTYREGIERGLLRDQPVQVFWAHFMGPIVVLSHMRDVGEIEVTDEILRRTFEGVARSVMQGTP